MDNKISIVVPVFNVEKYLERCINSLINQTYGNIEIILVDDKSPDNCPALCDGWAEKDSRIRVIHKEKNEGLGFARNTGIENATGDYITFVDSDDYLAENAAEKALEAIQKTGADIAIYGYQTVNKNGEVVEKCPPNPQKNLFEGEEIINTLLPDLLAPDTENGINTGLWMSSSGGLVSYKIISDNGFRFVSERDIISEDIYSLTELYSHIRKAVVLPEAFYFYCENQASLSHTYREDRYERIKHCYNETIKLCRRLGYPKKIETRIAYNYISNTIGAFKTILLSDKSKKEKINYIKEIVFDAHLQNVLAEYNISNESFNRRALLIAMKRKKWQIVYLLVSLKL